MSSRRVLVASTVLFAGACGGGQGASKPDAGTPEMDTGAPQMDAAPTDVPVVLPSTVVPIPADDPNIQYMGRFDTGQFAATATTAASMGTAKAPVAALGGSTATVRFMGTAAGVLLRGLGPDYFDAFVDGQKVGLIKQLNLSTPYPIAVDLPLGEHVVSVAKRTESNFGRSQFGGFVLDGPTLPPPPRPTRRIEFLGDSITAGFGMDAPAGDPLCMADGQGQPTEDAPLTFGGLVARDFMAEYHLVGVSGIGLMRNYQNTYDPRTLPQEFELVFPEPYVKPPALGPPVWDPTHTLWVPDAIVIALGTNDFGPGNPASVPPLVPIPDAATFAAAYIDFVSTLRANYPDAHIFAMTSPTQSAPALAMGIDMTVAHFADGKVHAIALSPMTGTGCTGHPSAAQHAALATTIEAVMRPALGW